MMRTPAPTIRLRLTAVYGGLFLLSGTALLTVTYFLVRHQYTGSFFITSGRAGIVAVGGVKALPVKPGLAIGPNPIQIRAAAHAQSSAALHQLLIDSGIALAIMAVLSIWLGWLIAGRALRPLRTITNAARDISASNLHKRLALDGPDDELKQLGTTFDGLLGRLEASFDAQRQFVANASHELRTPLTVERTLLEVALGDPEPTVESLQRVCRQVLAVGEQQEHLIEALLTLSRSQRGLDRREPVDLAAITAAASTAVDRDGLSFDTTFEPACTTGDARLVERLVANLVGNAVLHNVEHGAVEVRTATRDGRAVLRVANTGPKISPGERTRLFQPFQRLHVERTRGVDGLGLGLSIVDAIARAHDAVVTTVVPPSGGLEIEIGFPAASPV
ncbi:MAG TPA: HAMP domain-containing sensor histidine kinase [Gaiellaceae bacterium]|nr:HAMP domain-containing sensor histidine kinase [Gaiellaceae bacterium]